MNTEDLLSIGEAARVKGISRQSIHAAIERGDIKVIEVMEPTRKVIKQSLDDYKPNAKRKNCGPATKSPKKPRKSSKQ